MHLKRCQREDRRLHPTVRSMSQRHQPSLSRDSTLYRAIHAAIPLRRKQARSARQAYAWSARSLPGRLRARPISFLTAGMASTSGIRKRESCNKYTKSRLPAATHVDPQADDVCSRVCRDLSDFGPYALPAGADTLAASTQARSPGLVVLAQASEHCLLDALPNAIFHPFVGRGQQVMPPPQPSSRSEYSHDIPVFAQTESRLGSRNRRNVAICLSAICDGSEDGLLQATKSLPGEVPGP